MQPVIPNPPPGEWLPLNRAAAQVGLSPDSLLGAIKRGTAGVRCLRVGPRGLYRVAAADLPPLAARMAALGCTGGAL